jgi:putative endonuclease
VRKDRQKIPPRAAFGMTDWEGFVEKGGYVYIIGNWTGDVVYTGVTSNLEKRMYQHKNGSLKGFSSKYKTSKLLWYEQFDEIESAIKREKEIKAWRREKKNKLIIKMNPEWTDLTNGWFEDSSVLPLADRSE